MKRRFFLTIVLMIVIVFLLYSPAQAQNWTALPPYNLLWPLWSPVLSPVDPVTGLPTPLITQLTKDTLLPVMPCLVWNPLQQEPYPVYNSPIGIIFYDLSDGSLKNFPPPDLLDPVTALPLPITLPLGFSNLPIKCTCSIITANNLYSEEYGVPLSELLTYKEICGGAWQLAYTSLLESKANLALLRRYRDEFLPESWIGSLYKNFLYKNSKETLNVLLDNPQLMIKAHDLIKLHKDVVAKVLNGREGTIYNADEIMSFLMSYAKKSPPRLRFLINIVKWHMFINRKLGKPFLGFKLE